MEVSAAYAERLYHEVHLPALRASFVNVDDKAAAEIVAEASRPGGSVKPKTVRDKALELLSEAIKPLHLREVATVVKPPPLLPLEGISESAARGIVQAVHAGLVQHENWLRIYGVYERIRVKAGDREP